ncbi:hypothetical protein DERP_001027 [Dermatophagoides pteronyssinus]|uniref:Uncharacterized protein n=1 Tax=Dermatophagoides pteronyssinus TaxID=6956 RepID=A0ABQ8JDT6_DERPT|nr:hypothetical protein DERP_001027 [Dermatophagoides pteronyssinus]
MEQSQDSFSGKHQRQQIDNDDNGSKTKQTVKSVDEKSIVGRDESCVKARIKRYRSLSNRNSTTTVASNDSNQVIEYVSDKLKIPKDPETSCSMKMKKQAELIKRLLEQHKIQISKQQQPQSSEQNQQEELSESDKDRIIGEVTENFDESMQYIEQKIREIRKS